MNLKVISGEELIDQWKARHFPPIPRDEEWARFKWKICKAGEPMNPICCASGGEIQVEQFGIVGWLDQVKLHENCDNLKSSRTGKRPEFFMQCSLVEARETGTGKFGEWIESVKKFCLDEYDTVLAFHNITNEGLYKYAAKHDVHISDDVGQLFIVRWQPQ